MTIDEAIKRLDRNAYRTTCYGNRVVEHEENLIAIQALEEVQKYREIGSMEECRAAREKQIPKRAYHISPVDDNDNANVECPECHATTDYAVNVIKRGHCWKCGQLLDWSDENGSME